MIDEWSSKRKARVLELWAMSSSDHGYESQESAEGRMKSGLARGCLDSMTRFSKVNFPFSHPVRRLKHCVLAKTANDPGPDISQL
jgi:hypothetical protein